MRCERARHLPQELVGALVARCATAPSALNTHDSAVIVLNVSGVLTIMRVLNALNDISAISALNARLHSTLL